MLGTEVPHYKKIQDIVLARACFKITGGTVCFEIA
jgi:hypothetical protein